jgi:hypothetical protein
MQRNQVMARNQPTETISVCARFVDVRSALGVLYSLGVLDV